MDYSFSIPVTLDPGQISDLFTTAFEGHTTPSWVVIATVDDKAARDPKSECAWWGDPIVFANPFTITIKGREDEQVWTLDNEKLLQGLPRVPIRIMNDILVGDYDAADADTALQYVLFGDQNY